MTRMQGIISRIFSSRGFGFIRGDDGLSRFVHVRDTSDFDRLREGVKVSFLAVEHARGPRAVEVERSQ